MGFRLPLCLGLTLASLTFGVVSVILQRNVHVFCHLAKRGIFIRNIAAIRFILDNPSVMDLWDIISVNMGGQLVSSG